MASHESATRWLSEGVRLLEVDPQLGEDLGPDELADVQRHAVLPAARIAPGPWRPTALAQDEQVHGQLRGILLIDGSLTINVTLAGRTCTRLIAPSEMMLLDGDDLATLPLWWGWSAVETSRVAIFDDRLLVIGRRWPNLMGTILKRAAAQVKQALFQQAISQLPRVEDRLLALLWSVADRSGVVRSDGIWVRLPVTHDALAEMIGARRPTVSLGLRSLVEQGLVRSERDGWILDRASVLELSSSSGDSDEPSLGVLSPNRAARETSDDRRAR